MRIYCILLSFLLSAYASFLTAVIDLLEIIEGYEAQSLQILNTDVVEVLRRVTVSAIAAPVLLGTILLGIGLISRKMGFEYEKPLVVSKKQLLFFFAFLTLVNVLVLLAVFGVIDSNLFFLTDLIVLLMYLVSCILFSYGVWPWGACFLKTPVPSENSDYDS